MVLVIEVLIGILWGCPSSPPESPPESPPSPGGPPGACSGRPLVGSEGDLQILEDLLHLVVLLRRLEMLDLVLRLSMRVLEAGEVALLSAFSVAPNPC